MAYILRSLHTLIHWILIPPKVDTVIHIFTNDGIEAAGLQNTQLGTGGVGIWTQAIVLEYIR